MKLINVDVKFPFFISRYQSTPAHYDSNYVAWFQAIEYFSVNPFCFGDTKTCIKFDWKDSQKILLEREEFNFGVHHKKYKDLDEIIESFKLLRDKHISISCQVNGINLKASEARKSVNNFLKLLYLALNLAELGSAHISRVSVSIKDDEENNSESFLHLPSEPFEFAELFPSDYGYPKIKRLKFVDVWNWLNDLDVPNTPVAVNNTQRALFALLYSCEQEFGSPAELIWLAHALEALFDTPSMGISKALRERIFLVLGTPDNNSREILKKINEFYELRSKFVHGDTEILNPIANSHGSSDEVFEKHELPIGNAGVIARVILASTFQKMVENNWKKLEFSTIFKGV